jgi:hypothetical protein
MTTLREFSANSALLGRGPISGPRISPQRRHAGSGARGLRRSPLQWEDGGRRGDLASCVPPVALAVYIYHEVPPVVLAVPISRFMHVACSSWQLLSVSICISCYRQLLCGLVAVCIKSAVIIGCRLPASGYR